MAILQHGLTLEEFLTLPEREPALEYEAGVVRQKVSPKGPHGTLQQWLGYRFHDFARPRKLARVFTETRVTFSGSSLVPDLILYRWARVPRDARSRIPDDFTSAPDLVAEIVSPGQALVDLEQRCRWYAEHGVEITLLIHPRREWVRLYRPGALPRELTGDDEITLEDVLPGLRLTVRELFDELWVE